LLSWLERAAGRSAAALVSATFFRRTLLAHWTQIFMGATARV
jgi:hypothetical protein